MEAEMNDQERVDTENIKKYLKQGYTLAHNCPIEYLSRLKNTLNKHLKNNSKDKERWQALVLGFNTNAKPRLKERRKELAVLEARNYFKEFFRRR